jgi:hypothetical protein
MMISQLSHFFAIKFLKNINWITLLKKLSEFTLIKIGILER